MDAGCLAAGPDPLDPNDGCIQCGSDVCALWRAWPSARAANLCTPETPNTSLAHAGQLDVRFLQKLQQPIALSAPAIHQLAPVAGQVAPHASGLGRHETRPQLRLTGFHAA